MAAKIIYLASPYTHPRQSVMERRFEQVTTVSAKLINAGYIIYSPIMHFHPIAARHDLPKDFFFWEEINLTILSRCDELWILKLAGWAESVGINGERAFAALKSIPTKEINPAPWLI